MPDSHDLPSPPTTLRDRAAQLVMPRLGSNMPPPTTVEADAERALALVDRYPVGGFVLFNGAGEASTQAVLARLQDRARFPLLIGTDMERGLGQQVQGGTVFPHAMAFGALDDDVAAETVEAFARASAREALAVGFHLAFAPVADIHRDPRNPIIVTRAFGSNPSAVARLVRAYVRGARAEGLLTTAKHFPGHGGTSQDSHAEVPLVDDPREVLAATDLVPFRAAIAAGVDLVMPGHLRVPALDPSGQIATLSAPMLHSVLRDELGFQGVIVTDSLLMAAVRDRYDTPTAQAAALLQAGVDLLLDPVDPAAMVDGIVEAVEDGRVVEAQLDAAVGRVWRLKERFADRHGAAAFQTTPSRPDDPTTEHQLLADDVARNAIRSIAGRAEVLPLRPDARHGTSVLAVAVTSQRSAGDAEPPLLAGLRNHLPDVTTRCIGPDDEAALQALLDDAAAFDRVLVALLARPAAWQSYGLRPAQREVIQALTRRQPVVVAALGAPDLLSAYPDAVLRLCTYSDVPASQTALVQGLVGIAEIKGG